MTKNINITLLYLLDRDIESSNITLNLENFFHNIITIDSYQDAIEIFQHHKIEFIITHSPDINAIKFIKKIRAINSDIPLIVIASSTDIQALEELVVLNIQGYLTHPLKLDILSNLIEKNIKKIEKLRLLEQYQDIVDRSSIISKTNLKGIITYVNDEFCKVSGYSREELVGQNHNIVRAKDVPKSVFENLWITIRDKKETWYGTIKNRTKYGELYYVNASVRPIINQYGEIEEYIALRTLVTNIIHPKKQLLDFIKLTKNPIVILIKINDFNYIQNLLNIEQIEEIEQNFATELLKQQSNRFRFSKIYHLDRGEFALTQDMNSCEYSVEKIIDSIHQFQQNINQKKIGIEIESIKFNLSIIISLAYGKNAFENAQLGLKKLKISKKNFIIENNSYSLQRAESLKEIEILKMLQDAIESYNIISYFQPIVNNKTKEIEKYESLVRLIDGKKNILSPYFFLESSKKSQYYAKITSIVLKNSFKALEETNMNISINFSALDIERAETREIFFKFLEEYRDEAHRIILELVEDEEIKEFEVIKEFIKGVKEYHVQIAIDDFGTGYSNFQRILEYRPDFIKIDGSLIKNIENNQLSLDIVTTIVSFAKKQKIQTIAEFVENEETYKYLCKLGVDYSQGYYFGKPTILV